MAQEETRDSSQHHFHYNREERLAGRLTPERPRPKGIFKRNRSLTIILLDIIVIVIMFLLFQFIFTPGRGRERVGDFRVELSAFRFDGQVYATVEITRTREAERPVTGGDSLVTIQFEGDDEVLDTLPSSAGDRITATSILPDDGSDDGPPIRVHLELAGKSVTLMTRPKR
jgi:hypothetical protein